jgi:uncharacterized alkaline shock family protein YloU
MGGVSMGRETVNENGKIIISKEVLATIAGVAATDCFGVVGMTAKNIKDGIGTLLGRDSLSKGVEIIEKDDKLLIKVYIIVGYGTKISVVAGNVMQNVKYMVENTTGLIIDNVNVIVQGVRVLD